MCAPKSHVFGPVPSRRLGRSLGVDLVPHKKCSYDCIYCQLGPTTRRTIERGSYVSIDAVLDELEARLAATKPPDYITLSGSGEPTLQERLGDLIAGIKRITNCPIAVLTNGSLLWREDVQSELAFADLIIPSLDAGDEEMFQRVNRPDPRLRFTQVCDGLISFSRAYSGRVWLEVFLLSGLTTNDDQLKKIARLIEGIRPDRIQLNTVARPPTESSAQAASAEELLHAAESLGQRAEIVSDYVAAEADRTSALRPDDILALLERRPCTLDDVAAGLGAHRLEAAKHLERLLQDGAVVASQHGRHVYYGIRKP